MSGHNKWSTIKHKKGAADAKRGKLFTKLIKLITVAAREGGGDINTNPKLRSAVQTARSANMPNDNIDRAIKRGTGELEGVTYEELFYEGYGPKGVAIYVQCLTDNKNRTAAEVRSIFNKNNGNMANPGSVAWIFQQKGLITVKTNEADEEELMEYAIESGAEDFQKNEEGFEIYTAPQDFDAVKKAIEEKDIALASGDLTFLPKSEVMLEADEARGVIRLVDALEDNDDVQNVYTNADFSEDVLKELS